MNKFIKAQLKRIQTFNRNRKKREIARHRYQSSPEHRRKVRQANVELSKRIKDTQQPSPSHELPNFISRPLAYIGLSIKGIGLLFDLLGFLFTFLLFLASLSVASQLLTLSHVLLIPVVLFLCVWPGPCKFYVLIAAMVTMVDGMGDFGAGGLIPLELSLPFTWLPAGLRVFCVARGLSAGGASEGSKSGCLTTGRNWMAGIALFLTGIGLFEQHPLESSQFLAVTNDIRPMVAGVVQIVLGILAIGRILPQGSRTAP